MFVIRNTKRSYICYLSSDDKWKGLLDAKIFKTKEEAEEKLTEDGEILEWKEVVKLK